MLYAIVGEDIPNSLEKRSGRAPCAPEARG